MSTKIGKSTIRCTACDQPVKLARDDTNRLHAVCACDSRPVHVSELLPDSWVTHDGEDEIELEFSESNIEWLEDRARQSNKSVSDVLNDMLNEVTAVGGDPDE